MKYKLTEESKLVKGHKVFRIEALRDFSDVKKGDKGGWIQSSVNLSDEGNCWVYDDAVVLGSASVTDNAKICGKSIVLDFAKVLGNAQISGNSKVRASSMILGNAQVSGRVEVSGHSRVEGCSKITGSAEVTQFSWVSGNAKVSGKVLLSGNCHVTGNAEISKDSDYLCIKPCWSKYSITWTRSNNTWVYQTEVYTAEQLADELCISISRLHDLLRSMINLN